MIRHGFVAFALLALLSGSKPLYAQVTIDVSKITCEQFILFKVTDPQKIAIWLNGYHHAKRDNTVVDTQTFSEFFEKAKDYCRANFKMPVMQAVDNLIAGKK